MQKGNCHLREISLYFHRYWLAFLGIWFSLKHLQSSYCIKPSHGEEGTWVVLCIIPMVSKLPTIVGDTSVHVWKGHVSLTVGLLEHECYWNALGTIKRVWGGGSRLDRYRKCWVNYFQLTSYVYITDFHNTYYANIKNEFPRMGRDYCIFQLLYLRKLWSENMLVENLHW